MSLISGHSQAQSAYEPTLWAKLFHSVPHVNITLHHVDSRFNPENGLYLESLGILASVPAAWLIATLVILLIYLCTRCCDTKNTKKRKSRPIRCCLSFFSLVTMTALSVGFLGNHLLHEGIEDFGKATQNINHIVQRSQALAGKYNDVFQDGIEKNLNRLYDGTFQREIRQDQKASFDIMEASDIIFSNISSGLEAMDQLRFAIDEPNHRMSFQNLPGWAYAFEKYRSPTTMALQALFALFCLLLFVGAIVHSRCVLILFSVCGLFSIIVLWLLASVYSSFSVALADFCYNPTPWVQHVLSTRMGDDVSEYYLLCAPGIANPFESFISKSQRSISDIDRRVRIISSTARRYYTAMELSPFLDDLEMHTEDTMRLMDDLAASLRCDPIFRSYNTALVAVCDSGLFGLILLLISMAFSGLLFTVLVWCNSHTWIYFKHKGRYIKVDDQDPYMPLSTIERPRLSATPISMGGPTALAAHTPGYGRTRSIHTPPQTPSYHGTLNGRNNGHPHHSNSATLRSTMPTHQVQQAHAQHGQQQMGMAAGSVGYGHLTSHLMSQGPPQGQPHQHHAGTMGHYGSRVAGGGVGTLGRNTQVSHSHGGYQGMDNLPATMTLGRRGHYASVRGRNPEMGGPSEAPLMGPNSGQYATLSKQCKTLESSDFY